MSLILVKELQRIFLEHVYHVNIFAYRMPFEPDIIPLPEEFKKRFGNTGLSISSPNGGLPVTVDLEGGDNVDTFVVCPLLLTEEQVKTYEDIRKDNERMAPNYLIYNLFDEVDCRVLK